MPAFDQITIESGTNPRITLTFKNPDKTDRNVTLAEVTFTVFENCENGIEPRPLFETVTANPGPKANQKIVALTEQDTQYEGAFYTEITINDEAGLIEKWRGSLKITGPNYG